MWDAAGETREPDAFRADRECKIRWSKRIGRSSSVKARSWRMIRRATEEANITMIDGNHMKDQHLAG